MVTDFVMFFSLLGCKILKNMLFVFFFAIVTRCFRLIQHESGGTAKRNMPFVVFSRGHGILHLAILIGTSVRRSVCLYPAA